MHVSKRPERVPHVGGTGRPHPDPAGVARRGTAPRVRAHGVGARAARNPHPGRRRSGRARLEWLGLLAIGLIGLMPLIGGVAALACSDPLPVAVARPSPAPIPVTDSTDADSHQAVGSLAHRLLLAGLPAPALCFESGVRPRPVLPAAYCGMAEPTPAPALPPSDFATRVTPAAEQAARNPHPSRSPPRRS